MNLFKTENKNRKTTSCNLNFAHEILTPREEHPKLYYADGRCKMCVSLGIEPKNNNKDNSIKECRYHSVQYDSKWCFICDPKLYKQELTNCIVNCKIDSHYHKWLIAVKEAYPKNINGRKPIRKLK